MSTDSKAAVKARAHTRYLNAAGKQVPGVTTITGVMDKPALVKWANTMGLKGIDTTKYVDELAATGTLAHLLITSHLTHCEPDIADFTPNQLDLAQNGAIKWHYWADQHAIEPLRVEEPLVSEAHQYGGTPDVYCGLDGIPTLIDIKTCKACYDDHFTQVAGYAILLREHGLRVQRAMIVRIGRNDDEGTQPEVKEIGNLDIHIERFLLCRKLYAINAQIRKG